MNAYAIIQDYCIAHYGHTVKPIPTRNDWYMVNIGNYTTMYFHVVDNFIVDIQVD